MAENGRDCNAYGRCSGGSGGGRYDVRLFCGGSGLFSEKDTPGCRYKKGSGDGGDGGLRVRGPDDQLYDSGNGIQRPLVRRDAFIGTVGPLCGFFDHDRGAPDPGAVKSEKRWARARGLLQA